MIKIIWSEVKQTKLFILLFAVILIIVTTVSSVFSTASWKALDKLDEIKNTILQENITFCFENIGSGTLKKIDEMNFSYIDIKFKSENVFNENVRLCKKDISLNENISFVRQNDTVYHELMKNSVLKGSELFEIDELTSEYYPLWISKSFALKNDLNCDDYIYLEASNSKTIYFKIEGIYSDAGNIPNIFTNFSSYVDIFRKVEVSAVKNVTAGNTSYTESKKIAAKLDSLGIYYQSNINSIDDHISYYYNLVIIMLVLSVMIMSISLILFFTYIRLILIKRKHYISLLLILGMPSGKIVGIYSLIMESLVLFAAAVSACLVGTLYHYVEEIMILMTSNDFEFSSFSFSSFVFMIAVMSIFVLIQSAFLNYKLKNFREIDVTRGKE